MKRLHFIAILIIGPCICACKKDRMYKPLSEMLNQEIKIDSNKMIKIGTMRSKESKYTLYCYYDSSECHSCATNKIHLWDKFVSMPNTKNRFNVQFIFSTNARDLIQLQALILSQKLDYQIMFDTLQIIEKDNPFIPDNPLFHVFLVDNKTNRIVLVGDPRKHQKLQSLFENIILKDSGDRQTKNITKKSKREY